MTDRPPDHSPSDDPTRDVRLPPVPPPPPAYDALENQPTDRLPPRGAPARDDTLAFGSPAADLGHGRPPVGSPGPAGPPPGAPDGRPPTAERRWPWVLLVLLPLVVIAVAGLVLALLLGAG